MDPAVYVSLLRRCRVAEALSDGKRIHNCIIKSGLLGNTFLENNLLQMYSDCGAPENAWELFTNMRERNQFSWNFMIRAYARQQQGREAVDLFEQMQEEAVVPDKFIFVSMLSACSKSVTEGMHIHARIAGSGLESDVIVGTALISMYGKQASIDNARWLFDRMPEHNIISWNAMITVYAHGGQVQMAIRLSEQMQQEGISMDKVAFVSILHACSSCAALKEGQQMHAHATERGFEKDIAVGTVLVGMYGRCGSLENARCMFDKMPHRNAVSWTAMISVYAQDGQLEISLHLFKQMQHEGIVADQVTFASILDVCACKTDLFEGKSMHACVAGSPLEVDVGVGSALVNMYGKGGNVLHARSMFDKIREPNEISWNALVGANVQSGKIKEALQLCVQMQQERHILHKFTIVSLLCGCVSQGAVAEGKQSYSFIVTSGLEVDVMIGTALVNMYGKCGYLEDAKWIFSTLSERSMASWAAMIAACSGNHHGEDACKSFEQMQQEGFMPDRIALVSIFHVFANSSSPYLGKQLHACIVGCEFESDVALGTALINMYGRWGSLENAWTVFDSMMERKVVSWNSIIASYGRNGRYLDTLRFFQQMQQEGIIADKVTLISILDACACEAGLTKGKLMHACTVGHGFELDVSVANTLINMYGKCGSLDNAQSVFNALPARNLLSWTSMITVCAQHGQGTNALLLLDRMQQEGLVPDKVTYVSLLSACGHTGMVGDGHSQFLSMTGNYDILPVVDHLNCMIALLGRAGQLDEAEDLIKNMPIQPTAVSWTILLDACKRLFDSKRIDYAAKHILELDPEDALAYGSLSNLYPATDSYCATEMS